MPEVILPCPFCGNTSPRTTAKIDGVWCDKEECPNRQNTYAVDVWNALPRALRWTHEPPKVAGKYWWRPSGKKIGRIRDMFVRNGEVGFLDHNDRFIKDTGDGEWAGPIPAPLD